VPREVNIVFVRVDVEIMCQCCSMLFFHRSVKNKKTTVVVFLQVKCNDRYLSTKASSVLGAKKNPTRISKYGNVPLGTDKQKHGGRLTA
jgi:hypothetical protein